MFVFVIEAKKGQCTPCYPKKSFSVSHCWECVSVREDNPIALGSGLLPFHTRNLYNNLLVAPACISLCVSRYI